MTTVLAGKEGSIAILEMAGNGFHRVGTRVAHGEIRSLRSFREGLGLVGDLHKLVALSKVAQQR